MANDARNAWQPESVICGACGTANLAGDRFCAECGATLPAGGQISQADDPAAAVAAPSEESAAWLLAARPGTVIGGGLVLIVAAVALLFLGQLDATGSIVMLSFCVAPLGLIVILIGIIRMLTGAVRR